jgi:hypothetical protein
MASAKDLAVLMGVGLLATGSMAYTGTQLDAAAVSVQWRGSGGCEGSHNMGVGAIMRYAISGSAVQSSQTIYPRDSGLAYCPNFNLAGTMVAFYRMSTGSNSSGACISNANGGKATISVINANGTGLKNLCILPNNPGGEMAMDWPAGDYIYYSRPLPAGQAINDGGQIFGLWSAGDDIWKVNVNTGATSQVCFLKSNGQSTYCDYIRRFTTNLSATYCAIQNMEQKYGCSLGPAFPKVNHIFPFPLVNCDIATNIGYKDGCNISISPSGNFVGSYSSTDHEILYLDRIDYTQHGGPINNEVGINPTIANMEAWSGHSIGVGSEHIRWAVNSDKWVMQEVGWVGHADQIAQGSNQVVCNWVDKVAINISNNPSSTRLNNCPGDLWVSDPANNAGGNKYEDETGAWHTVPGTAARESGACVGRDGMFSEIAGAPSGHAAAVRVRIPHQGPWELAIAAANGRTVRSLTGTTGGDIELAASGLGAGVRVVTFAQDGMRFVKRLVVR